MSNVSGLEWPSCQMRGLQFWNGENWRYFHFIIILDWFAIEPPLNATDLIWVGFSRLHLSCICSIAYSRWVVFSQVKKTPIIKAKPLKLDYNSRLKKKYGRYYEAKPETTPQTEYNGCLVNLILTSPIWHSILTDCHLTVSVHFHIWNQQTLTNTQIQMI